MKIVRNQKKVTRILSIAVVIVMLLSLVPIQAIAYSEEYDAVSVPNVDVYTELTEIEEQFKEVEHTYGAIAPLSAVSVGSWDALRIAVNDITVTEIIITTSFEAVGSSNSNAIIIPTGRNIILTGNGVTLTQTTTGQRHFLVNGTLSIEGVVLSGSYPNITSNHGGVQVNAGGSFYMEEGSGIQNNRNTSNSQASAVFVTGTGAQFTMNGGEISSNSSFNMPAIGTSSGGAAVFIQGVAEFTMNGGVIRNNIGRFGGGVRIGTGAPGSFIAPTLATAPSMHMTGGEIYGNTALFGGGVNIEWGTFTMEDGGIIRANRATALDNNGANANLQANRGGGGIFMQNSGIFNMNGGTISNNHSYNHGGGIMMLAGTAFNMYGGTISGNNADYNGGGVAAALINAFSNPSAGTIMINMASAILEDETVTSGTIIGNTAINGAGIWLTPGINAASGSQLIMTDGTITGNIATSTGGGIWLGTGTATTNARLNMTGGTISNNIATLGNGGGIFTASHTYANPLPLDAYPNIIAADGNFFGNTAGGGQFAPPTNASSFSFGHLLTNYDINYRGTFEVAIVTFNLNSGSVDVGGSVVNVVYVVVPIDDPIGINNVPVPVRDYYTFAGWRYTGQTSPYNLSNEYVADYIVIGAITFTAQWSRSMHTVTFEPGTHGNLEGGTPNVTIQLDHGSDIPAAQIPIANADSGWIFYGWRYIGQEPGTPNLTNTDIENLTVDREITFVAQWVQQIEYTITFNLNNGNVNGSVVNVVYSVYGEDIIGIDRVPVPVRAGFSFIGWQLYGTGYIFSATQVSEIVVDENMTFVAQWVRRGGGSGNQNRPPAGGDGNGTVPPSFTEEHIAYIAGFPDGTFRTTQSLTRAEISMILFRLIDDDAKHSPQRNHFSDVSSGAWYAQAVNYLASHNILEGYQDGTFRPNAHITRAELAAVMSRFFEMSNVDINGFSDVAGSHWAYAYINNAYNKGWIIGYADGTFRPNSAINRAEAVTLINRVLDRVPNPVTIEYHLAGITIFTDITSAHWAFYEIMEAAVLHEFEIDDNGLEIWTEVISFPAQY